ncbi:MAG: F-box [Chlamydiales bacterium]|jgi:hypothetical protein|nr:F-box [Chlamydiales bacterium]
MQKLWTFTKDFTWSMLCQLRLVNPQNNSDLVDTLPNQLLSKIFNYLEDKQDLKTMPLVCKKWKILSEQRKIRRLICQRFASYNSLVDKLDYDEIDYKTLQLTIQQKDLPLTQYNVITFNIALEFVPVENIIEKIDHKFLSWTEVVPYLSERLLQEIMTYWRSQFQKKRINKLVSLPSFPTIELNEDQLKCIQPYLFFLKIVSDYLLESSKSAFYRFELCCFSLRQEMPKLMDLDNPKSPMRILKKMLMELQDCIGFNNKDLGIDKLLLIEQKRKTFYQSRQDCLIQLSCVYDIVNFLLLPLAYQQVLVEQCKDMGNLRIKSLLKQAKKLKQLISIVEEQYEV